VSFSVDDRIRELCASAVTTTDPAKVDLILAELRTAIFERQTARPYSNSASDISQQERIRWN